MALLAEMKNDMSTQRHEPSVLEGEMTVKHRKSTWFYVHRLSVFVMLLLVVLGSFDVVCGGGKLWSSVRFPDEEVGPSDWHYYQVELPPAFSLLTVSLTRNWPQEGNGSNADGSVPLVCFGFHGPPLPVPPSFSLIEAVIAAGSDHNASVTGKCGWLKETLVLNVTNFEVLSGLLHVGIFSDGNPTRTQSKMIPRGHIYSFGLSIEVFHCGSTEILGGPDCNLKIGSRPPVSTRSSHPLTAASFSGQPLFQQEDDKEIGFQIDNDIISIQASALMLDLSELTAKAGATSDEQLTNARHKEKKKDSATSMHSEQPIWIPLSHQCVGINDKQFFSIQVVDFVSDLQIKYDCLSNVTHGISKCEEFESMIKEDRIPLLHLRYGALPRKDASDYVGETSTGSIIVSLPKRGLWYLAIFNPTVSSNQDKERKEMEGEEDKMCFSLSWRTTSCGPDLIGISCKWPVIRFERIVKPQYESPFDSYYLPASKPDLLDLWTEWVSLQYLFNTSTWNITNEQWGFVILEIPDGASGAVLTIDVKTSLSAYTELYLRHEGCPTNGNWEFQLSENQSQHLSMSDVETLHSGTGANDLQMLKGVKYRTLSLPVVYPMEGYWCLGMRFVPYQTTVHDNALNDSHHLLNGQLILPDKQDWKQSWKHYFVSSEKWLSSFTKSLANEKLTSSEGGDLGNGNLLSRNDMQLRVTLHGCSNECSGHGNCRTDYDSSRLHFISYCHCDVTHGDIDCSAVVLGIWSDLRQIVFLVFSNTAAILPSIWALRHKAYSEWITFTLSGIASAIYHSCDAGGWCALSYSTLQFLDFWLSFLAIGMTCLYMAGFSGPMKAMLHIACAVLTAAVAKEDATSGWSVLVVVLMSSAGLLLGWGLETQKVSILLLKWRTSPTQVNVPGIHFIQRWTQSFYVQLRDRFRWSYLWLGLAFLLSALLGNRMELPQTYWFWHSWWHVSIYTSAFILLHATRYEEGTCHGADDSNGYRIVRDTQDETGITDSHEALVLELDSLPENRDH